MELINGKIPSKRQNSHPNVLVGEDNEKIESVKRKLLSNSIGRITSIMPIDIEEMRKITQDQASKEIHSEDNKTNG